MSEASPHKAPRWAWWIATGFGSGCLRPAPGTWGSLAALLAWCLFTLLVPLPFTNWASAHPGHPRVVFGQWLMEGLFLALLLGMGWMAVRASDAVVLESGQKDPGFIVADEWLGMWIALWPLRWNITLSMYQLFSPWKWPLLMLLLVPFLAFRAFDIWKPWPVRQLQDLPGGQGVVADDLVAGLYAIPFVMLVLPPLLGWLQRIQP